MPEPSLTQTRPGCQTELLVPDYDLDVTMTSGQVFGWEPTAEGWVGVVGTNWVCLQSFPGGIRARTATAHSDWTWLRHFLQTGVNLPELLATFPANDAHLTTALASCRGLRLLRQSPWECLASFILSSTKQIVQIRQIVRTLCARYGTPVTTPANHPPAFAFPTAARIANLSEQDLRDCKMGFRAKYLSAAAQRVAAGELPLEALRALPLPAARDELTKLPGVGEKIADCVLLFAYGFPTAFPIDVWVARALSQFYFKGRRKRPDQLRQFALRHFGPNAGYAQQYLFHHIRTRTG
ncbi:MAG TPA: DNA glycosylase [Verrucomicrobiae bacterium]|nr:DNA glycosylase [Verrucomicrobiae bacterium]